MAVERDSRTFKQAASLGRLGYRSLVVEGEASGIQREGLPFELITIPGALPAWGADGGGNDAGPARGEAAGKTDPQPAQAASAWRALAGVLLAPLGWLRRRTFSLRWHLGWNRRTYRSLPDARLYIVHSYLLSPAVLLKTLFRRRTALAYDAHDAYFEIRPGQSEPTGGQRAWELVERFCVGRAREFVTVSEGVAGMLEERFGRRPRVIRNAHDLRLDHAVDAGLRELVGLSGKEFLLVSIGNYKEGMTVGEALRALSMLPGDVHLAFLGRGHEQSRGLIEELGVEERAHPVGSVAPTEVASFVRDADAAVVLYGPLTRSYESALPNGLFQGIAAGLPTLYPLALPEVAAVAESHGLGLAIDTSEPASIAAAVERLRRDPKLARQLGENASRAREVENWEHEETRLVQLVEAALDRSSSAADGVEIPAKR